jgi:hypothetical protein
MRRMPRIAMVSCIGRHLQDQSLVDMKGLDHQPIHREEILLVRHQKMNGDVEPHHLWIDAIPRGNRLLLRIIILEVPESHLLLALSGVMQEMTKIVCLNFRVDEMKGSRTSTYLENMNLRGVDILTVMKIKVTGNGIPRGNFGTSLGMRIDARGPDHLVLTQEIKENMSHILLRRTG